MNEAKQKVSAFLKDCRMHHRDIDMQQLCDVITDEIQNGLKGLDSSLAMIPTYIEVCAKVPKDTPVIVLDAGGTNFRVAKVHFDRDGKAVIDSLTQNTMPGIENQISKEDFFTMIADYISHVADSAKNIGFCFSYPTEILPNKDGRLIRFCKEVKAPQVHGQLIGQNLLKAMPPSTDKRKIVILNDTVATMLAGVSASGQMAFDTYIGFILGTGTNCCYTESNRNIEKLTGLNPNFSQIINVESGNFARAPRGTIDMQLDESTLNPGQYTFEKMFSGAYLGPLCLKALQQAARQNLFSNTAAEKILAAENLKTIEVNDFLQSPHSSGLMATICKTRIQDDIQTVWHILNCLIERAAKVVAANLSAVILKTEKGKNPCNPVCITAEGTTFYQLKSLKSKIEYYLKSFLQDKHNRYVEIVNVDNATLIGAAIAGLTN